MRLSRWALGPPLALFLFLLACPTPPMPPPAAGFVPYRALALLDVPGGRVDAAGGGALLRRIDLSIDTRLGTREVGATWSSASGSWQWSFELRFDGDRFVDASGAEFFVTGLSPGQAIPGSGWRFLDARTLATRGGWIHEFDAGGRLARVHWASSAYPSLVWRWQTVAGARRVVGVDQCSQVSACSRVYDVQRDAQGRVSAIVDRAGRQALFGYGADGLLASARDPLDVARGWAGFRYEYAGGQLRAVTNSEGERVEWDCDGLGRVLAVRPIGPGMPVWSFQYLEDDLYTTELRDPLGALTRVRFDGLRRVRSVENGAGELTAFEWQGLRPTARIAPDGSRTEWTWLDDDLVAVRAPSGQSTSFQRVPGAVDRHRPFETPIARIADALGVLEERVYDTQGRLVEQRNGAGEATRFVYDADEMLESVVAPDGGIAHYAAYGEHGHATSWVLPEGSFQPTYDEVGNQLSGPASGSEADPLHGGVVSRSFDEDRNLASVVLAEGRLGSVRLRTLTLQHGSDGRRLAILRPYGGDTRFVHDAFGREIRREDRSEGRWVATNTERDLLGRVVAIERANGMRQEWGYDAAGRVTRHTILRDGVTESEALSTWSQGRLVQVHDSAHGDSPETRAYDAFGRLVRIDHPGGEHTWIAYDLRSRVTARILGDTATGFLRSLGIEYDAGGRPVSLLDGSRLLLDRQYIDGRLERLRYGNGLVRSFAYGSRGQLAQTFTRDGSGQLVETTQVTESCVFFMPLCTQIDTWTAGSPPVQTVEQVQLRAATDSGLGSNGGARLDAAFQGAADASWYEFDALSNETDRFGVVGACNESWSFGYDAERTRLQSADSGGCGRLDYTYDEAGFVVDRSGVPIGWDGAGRLRSLGPDLFRWDTEGRPLSRTQQGVTTTWRFGGLVEADALGRPRALDLGELRIDLVGGGEFYRHFDFRGNVKFVTDGRGRVVAHHRYGAYGALAGGSGALAPEADRRFAQGGQLGAELVLLGHRLLDTRVGRFLAPDPVYQLLQQYAYTLGNPVQYWDPGGLYQLTVARALSITSVAVGAGALVVTSPAWALGLGVASLSLSVAALVVDAITSEPAEAKTPDCLCMDPSNPGPEGSSNSTPGSGSAGTGVQIKVLSIQVLEATEPGGLGGLGALGLGAILQLGGLLL